MAITFEREQQATIQAYHRNRHDPRIKGLGVDTVLDMVRKDYANSSHDRNLVVAHVFLGLCCGLICACYVVLSGSLRKAWKKKKYNRRQRLHSVDII